MTSILFPILILAVWLFWIPVCVWERAAKGAPGGVSIFPGIPVFPLAAWGMAAALDWFHDGLGFRLVGGLHILLLCFFLVSSFQSINAIRRNKHDDA